MARARLAWAQESLRDARGRRGRACPRVTPSTAPPTGSHRALPGASSSGPSCAGRRCPTSTCAGRAPSRSWPAASTCCTASTPGRRCTPTCGWRASGGSSTRGPRTDRALRRQDLRAAVLTDTLVGARPAAGDARPRADRSRGRPRRPPRPGRARSRLGRRPRGRPAHGIRPLRRRRPARPAGARRGGHVLGERGPLPRAGAAVDAGPRPRPRERRTGSSTGCTGSWTLARRTGWQASTGMQRSGEEAYVHARSGRPCRRCGDTVRVATTGEPPRERTMF